MAGVIGNNQEGARPITLKDIAEECGVNVGTVSRALRSDSRLSKTTIDRIRASARAMGYDASRNHAARRLAMSRFGQPVLNNMAGMFFHHGGFCQSAYFFKVLQGVLDTISKLEFELCTSDQAAVATRNELPINYRRGDVDGVVMISQAENAELAVRLLREEFAYGEKPIVGLVEHIPGCSGVYSDDYQSGRMVAEHLIRLGHRRILHYHNLGADSRPNDAHVLRLNATRDALCEAGLKPDEVLFTHDWLYDYKSQSATDLLAALKEHREITAIIAHDDEQAAEIHTILTEAGYCVPDDISLISYDDTVAVPGPDGLNILTTVRLPLVEIGKEGTKLLIRRILGEETEDRDIVLPTELIVRGSTAIPRR